MLKDFCYLISIQAFSLLLTLEVLGISPAPKLSQLEHFICYLHIKEFIKCFTISCFPMHIIYFSPIFWLWSRRIIFILLFWPLHAQNQFLKYVLAIVKLSPTFFILISPQMLEKELCNSWKGEKLKAFSLPIWGAVAFLLLFLVKYYLFYAMSLLSPKKSS